MEGNVSISISCIAYIKIWFVRLLKTTKNSWCSLIMFVLCSMFVEKKDNIIIYIHLYILAPGRGLLYYQLYANVPNNKIAMNYTIAYFSLDDLSNCVIATFVYHSV
uniref:Uncharacterized protein n=1 Tax=Heterorhabditis bacteriophora TaxID=37862 RepID=A0A1I7W9X4_HETBA